MNIPETMLGGVEVKRTYRPARIICDVISLAGVIVIVKIANGLFVTGKFLGWVGTGFPLLFILAAVGICVAYVLCCFTGGKFEKYTITKKNAQSVYDWWTFLLSLVKIPLLLALLNGEFMFRNWAAVGKAGSVIPLVLDALIAAVILRLMKHRITSLTKVKKENSDDSAVKVKAKLADEEKDED